MKRPLVMTSGNLSDEPMAVENDEAVSRLRGIADAFLVHDRPIATRTDDSVARVVSGSGTEVGHWLGSSGFSPEQIKTETIGKLSRFRAERDLGK